MTKPPPVEPKRCVGCDRGIGPGVHRDDGVVDECLRCRRARLRPLVDHLEGYTLGEQEAFVRGILWARCKDGDLIAISELGRVLDDLRSVISEDQ